MFAGERTVGQVELLWTVFLLGLIFEFLLFELDLFGTMICMEIYHIFGVQTFKRLGEQLLSQFLTFLSQLVLRLNRKQNIL